VTKVSGFSTIPESLPTNFGRDMKRDPAGDVDYFDNCHFK